MEATYIKLSKSIYDDKEIPFEIKNQLETVQLPKDYYQFSFTYDEEVREIEFYSSNSESKKCNCWKIGYLTENPNYILCLKITGEVGFVYLKNMAFDLLNSSLEKFEKCLHKYMDMHEKFVEGILDAEDDEVRIFHIKQLKEKLSKIDPIVLDQENYWSDLLYDLEHLI